MPAVNGKPDNPLDADERYNLDNLSNQQALQRVKLGDFLKAFCQKLDADRGVAATDFEATFCP